MLVDASPLIYLAKLEALDVFATVGYEPLVTPAVERETSRAGLAYVYPDAALISQGLRTGVLSRTQLTAAEESVARRLGAEAGGLDPGEAEVLAAAATRSLPVLLFERRALRLARSLGVEAWSPVRLLIDGTPDPAARVDRLTRFARLVQMRFEDLERLVGGIEEGR